MISADFERFTKTRHWQPGGCRARDLVVEVPNPKTQIPGKISKYPNSNWWHQLLWEVKPWDLVLGVGISIVGSLSVSALRDDGYYVLRTSLHPQLPDSYSFHSSCKMNSCRNP